MVGIVRRFLFNIRYVFYGHNVDIGGDEKGTRAWRYNWATLFLGDINTGT
jgi:hypothetical protein